jgi:hypothetical protein
MTIGHEADSNLNGLVSATARRDKASACFTVEQAAAEDSKQRRNDEKVEHRKILNYHGHDAPPP